MLTAGTRPRNRSTGAGRTVSRPTGAGRARSRLPRRLLSTVAALLLVLVAGAAPAVARGNGGGTCPPTQENCDVWGGKPGTPGKPGGGGGDTGGGGGDGGGTRTCYKAGQKVPCYDPILGWFNSSDECYYKLQEPQPADTPEGKQWYLRSCNAGGMGLQEPVLLDAPPPGFEAPPDPADLAARALATITLKPPTMGIAPKDGPGLVGLPVWLWTTDDANHWGPITASASERGVTVTITAEVARIVWEMGDGEQVTCTKAGVEYAGQGGESPECGYDNGYRKAGGYTVTATTYWKVDWDGGGETGVINTERTNSADIEIDELQVVTE